jgi:rubrerythrin
MIFSLDTYNFYDYDNLMQIIKLTCGKCGYSWVPRKDNPKECPACKNRNWNMEDKK